MNSRQKAIRSLALWGSLTGLAAGGMAGCSSHFGAPADPAYDVPPGAMPAENGAYVREFIYRQAAKAEADDFVIYLYEWVEDSADLGPFGRKHVAAALRRLTNDAPFSILIEASTDPKVDQQRYLAIADILGQLGVADAPARVRIGVPGAEGLFGDEAERAYGRLLQGGMGGFGRGIGNFGGLGGYGGFGGAGGVGGFGGFGGFGGGFGGAGGYGGGYGGGYR